MLPGVSVTSLPFHWGEDNHLGERGKRAKRMNAASKSFKHYSHLASTSFPRVKGTGQGGKSRLPSSQRPHFRPQRNAQRYGVRPTKLSLVDGSAETEDVDEFELANKLQGSMWRSSSVFSLKTPCPRRPRPQATDLPRQRQLCLNLPSRKLGSDWVDRSESLWWACQVRLARICWIGLCCQSVARVCGWLCLHTWFQARSAATWTCRSSGHH